MKKRRKRFSRPSKKDIPTNSEHSDLLPGQTYRLHNDDRETLVLMGEHLYELHMSPLTVDEVKKMEGKKRPHVRFLNPIIKRSRAEQLAKNAEADVMHGLYMKTIDGEGRSSKKVTSVQRAIKLGKDVPEEVKKLLAEKEKALKGGDTKKAREIRATLRRLDYKRYTKKGE